MQREGEPVYQRGEMGEPHCQQRKGLPEGAFGRNSTEGKQEPAEERPRLVASAELVGLGEALGSLQRPAEPRAW